MKKNSEAHFFSSYLVIPLLLGALVRLYLIAFTEGTQDVDIWQSHAG